MCDRRVLAATLLLAMPLFPGRATSQRLDGPRVGEVTGTVWGIFQGGSRRLPEALIEVWAPGVRLTVAADSSGRYRVESLPAGRVRLRVTHAGHDPRRLEVIVPGGLGVQVDIELRARPLAMPALEVTAAVDPIAEPTPRDPRGAGVSLPEVEAVAVEGATGIAQSGLTEALRSLSGNDPADPTDVLFMRGSTTDLKLVLLDGAPVYTPFHVAGLLRAFEPAVLGGADLHVGGAPARFDGGLTSILDLRTRRPNAAAVHASGSIDLISATAAVNGPVGDRAGFLASARRLHDLGAAPLGSSPYGYQDALLSVHAEVASDHILKGTGFWNRESVVLDLPGALGRPSARLPDEAAWSNRAVSFRYEGRIGGLFLDAIAAAGDYEASLPLQPAGEAGKPLPDPLMASAANERVRTGLEVSRPGQMGVWRAGLGYERIISAYGAEVLGVTRPTLSTSGTAHTVGGYVDVTRTVAREFSVRAGLRADRFSGQSGGVRLAPRASVAWSFAPTALLTVAAGRYHQHARISDDRVEESLAGAAEGGLQVLSSASGAALHPVATADHVVVSLDQELGAETRLGLEGFWKEFTGVRPDQDQPIRSSGVDLRIQRRAGTVTGWLGYGLSWYWSAIELNGTNTEFAGRHLLSAGIDGPIRGAFGGEARVAYGAGIPYTSLPFRVDSESLDDPVAFQPDRPAEVLETASPLSGGPEDSFFRLDLEFHATLTPEWGGRSWTLRPYLRLLNALDRRDALFYAFEPWRQDGLTPLAERSIVPVLGLSWRF